MQAFLLFFMQAAVIKRYDKKNSLVLRDSCLHERIKVRTFCWCYVTPFSKTFRANANVGTCKSTKLALI